MSLKSVVVGAIVEGIHTEMPKFRTEWEVERQNYFVDFGHTHQEHYAGDSVMPMGIAVTTTGSYMSAGQPFSFRPQFPPLIRN